MQRFCEQLGIGVFVLVAFWGCSGGIDDLLGVTGRKDALSDPKSPAIPKLKESSLVLDVDPKQVGGQANWKTVDMGSRHLFAVNAQGDLFAGLLPTAQHDKTPIHLVSVLSDLPASEDIKMRFSATHACVGFSGGRLFCGPLSNDSLQPVYLSSVTGGTDAQQWDLKGNALCILTGGGSLACTRLPHGAAGAPRVQQEVGQEQWLNLQVGADSVCATREKPSGEIGFFCGVVPADNKEPVKLIEASGDIQWKADGFRIRGGFVCASTAGQLYCGLAPTSVEQSIKMTELSTPTIQQDDLFAMGISPRGQVRLCVYYPQELKCGVLEAKGDKLKTPVSLNQTGKGGPTNVTNTKLYLEGNDVWIGADGGVGPIDDPNRKGKWYSAHVVQAGDILKLGSVSDAISLHWSRVSPSPRGHAYVLEKSSADNAQYTLWAMPANKTFAQVKKPDDEPSWHYDPNNQTLAVGDLWACGLRREGTTSRANSLWCWRHGKVKRSNMPAVPDNLTP
ncbi:MAG: hypothetical protein AAF320_05195 [Myxococcota bacterium]